MSNREPMAAIVAGPRRRQLGAALVLASLLLLVVTLTGVAGLAAASLELRMSGNLQYQEQAFQAAEFAIEQALRSVEIDATCTLGGPRDFPGSGQDATVPGMAGARYSYRIDYVASATARTVTGDQDVGTEQVACHFVISATGTSSNGAAASHVQGFYVLEPAVCSSAQDPCSFADVAPTQTYWTQEGAE